MMNTKLILLGVTLLSLVSYTAWSQSARAPGTITMPTATVTELTVGAGDITFSENSETISNPTDGALTFTTSAAASAVTINCADDDANATCIYDSGGTGNVEIGSADTGQIILNVADPNTNAVTLQRPTAGVGVYQCLDDAGGAPCRFQAGGAGTASLGSPTNVSVQVNTADTDLFVAGGALSVRRSDTGSATLDIRDYGDTDTDDMAHTLFTTDCTDGGATENCDLTIGVAVGGSVKTIVELDGDEGNDGSEGSVTLGYATAERIFGVTGGGSFYMDSASPDTFFVLATDDGDTAVFAGLDGSNPSNTRYDTGGAGTVTVGSADVTAVNVQGADLTLQPDNSGTNVIPNTAGATPAAHNQIIGLPKLNVTNSGAALPNGTTTAELVTPLAGTCAPITAGTETDDAVNYVTGSASYQYTAQATAAEDDGFDCDVTGHAVNGTDTAGFWFMTDTALTAGTLDMTLDDGGVVEANADLPAISVTNQWVWIEVDFGADCDATCASIDGLFVQVTAAGAATSEMDGTVIHIDTGGFWLDSAELAIGDVLVGGVINVTAGVVAGGASTSLTEYTDYLVTYQSGADALVFITDQSANYATTLEALQ